MTSPVLEKPSTPKESYVLLDNVVFIGGAIAKLTERYRKILDLQFLSIKYLYFQEY
jgi:hypothetical protein